MNVTQILQLPFIQVALPILIGFFTMGWINNSRLSDMRGDMNRRLDEMRGDMNRQFDEMRGDMNRRFDAVIKRLDRIEHKLEDHETRITRVEERTSPLAVR